MFLFSRAPLYGQSPQWYLGSDRLDFRSSPANSAISGVNPNGNAPNEAYDLISGNDLPIKIVDGIATIFNSSTATTTYYNVGGGYYMTTFSTAPESYETAIIPVPGQCKYWYVIGIRLVPSGSGIDNFYLNYITVDMTSGYPVVVPVPGVASNINTVSTGASSGAGAAGPIGYRVTPTTSLDAECYASAGMAISKYRPATNDRLLFTIAPNRYTSGLQPNNLWGCVFKVNANGIQFSHSFAPIAIPGDAVHSSSIYGYGPKEVELYEDVSGTMKLAFGGWGCGFSSLPYGVTILDLNSSAVPTGIENIPVNGYDAHGLEFYDNGNRLLVSCVSNVYALNPVVGGGYSPYLVPNSSDYGYGKIETDKYGKLWVRGQPGLFNRDIREIDVSTAATPTMVNTATVSTTGVTALATYQNYTQCLPDQVDNELYGAGNPASGFLTAKDDNLDIGAEPNNRSTSFTASPDLWNVRGDRLTNTLAHNNPTCFYSKTPASVSGDQFNILRFRVRNNTCAPTTTMYAKLYWTYQGGGIFPDVWDGTVKINGHAVGGEITTPFTGSVSSLIPGNATSATTYTSQGFVIPPLQPGEDYIINAAWLPTPPDQYYSSIPSTINLTPQISFLARILDPAKGGLIDGEIINHTVSASTNAIYSKSIVMRDANIVAPGFLMAHDNLADIGSEPYLTTSDVWHSQDLWNRAHDVTSQEFKMEDPDYSTTTKYNVVRFRVKNHGSEVSPPSYARIYWTVGTTAKEVWPYCWKENSGGSAYYIPGTTQPYGEELKLNYSGPSLSHGTKLPNGTDKYPATGTYQPSPTSSTEYGFLIPELEPGDEYIVNAKWHPIDPRSFPQFFGTNQLVNPEICLLGRVVNQYYDPMKWDPTFNTPAGNTGASFSKYVRDNNNVVTTNASLVHLNPPNFARYTIGGSFFASNNLETPTNYDIRIFDAAGNTSPSFNNVATCTVKVDSLLWFKWLQGGGQTTGLQIADPALHTFAVTDMNNARLKNVNLVPDEMRLISLGFDLISGVTDTVNFDIVATQEPTDPTDSAAAFAANYCHFLVYVNDAFNEPTPGDCFEDVDDGSGGTSRLIRNGFTQGRVNEIKVFPNPANNQLTFAYDLLEAGKVTIKITDWMGRLVRQASDVMDSGVHETCWNTDNYPTGMYYVSITIHEQTSYHKIVVIH